MCGSFLLMAEAQDLLKYYAIDDEVKREYEPGDFFPKKITPIIIDDGKRSLQFAEWGFPLGEKKLVINARSETIMNKPMFKDSFYYRRCVVPANNFYEWKDVGAGRKTKYKIFI